MTPLSACAAASDVPDATFACANDMRFEVRYADAEAQVTTAGGVHALAQRSSSIGRRFASAAATLLVDDDSASLVVDGEPRYVRCRRV